MIVREEIDVVASDFDGTIAKTFEPSPNGIGVETCYAMALRDIFGCATLLKDIGGLQNRAPTQVIAAVLKLDSIFGSLGEAYYQRHRVALRSFMPANRQHGKLGVGLVSNLTETLVRVRLQYLLSEISEEWPKPYDGVLDFFDGLDPKKKAGAIITSGHTLFIEKVFRTWKRTRPKFMVTDDDMRATGFPPEMACKPNRILMDALHITAAFAGFDANVIAYVGDCRVKDRGFARNSDVRFGLFNPAKADVPEGFGVNEFQFHDWNDLHKQLN
jgi:hypothetical protein